MPIYEYACPECGHTFEEWLAHPDTAVCYPCPACKRQAQRILSNTTFILKGGGWYETDYGKKKEDAPAAQEAEPATKPETADANSAAGPASGEATNNAAQATKGAETPVSAPAKPKAPVAAPPPTASQAPASSPSQTQ